MTKTKSALVLSMLFMIGCLSMLIGTTFAWFTHSQTIDVNQIQAGNLEVKLEMQDAGSNWVDAEGSTIKWVAADEREDIVWEPGCTYQTQAFRVLNEGNLAFKYKFVVSGIDGDKKLLEVLNFSFNYKNEEVYDLSVEKSLAASAKSDSWYLVAKMNEEAGNEYQGLELNGLAITVSAKQDTSEADSFSASYDGDAVYVPVVYKDTSALGKNEEVPLSINNGSAFAEQFEEAETFEEVLTVLEESNAQYSLRTDLSAKYPAEEYAAVLGCYYPNFHGIAATGDIILTKDSIMDQNNGFSTTMSVIVTEDMTIDLAGHTLTQKAGTGASGYAMFKVLPGATLNIIDSVGGGCLNAVCNVLDIYPGGVVNVYGGTLACSANKNATYDNEAATVYNRGGEFNNYGGVIELPSNFNYSGSAEIVAYKYHLVG